MTQPEMTEILARAEARFKAGAAEQAADLLVTAVPGLAPEKIVPFTRKAEALLIRNGARFAALDCVEAALRVLPEHADLLILRLAGLLRLGRSPEAIRLLEHWQPETPPPAYWRYQAQVAMVLGDPARALQAVAAARGQGHDDAALRVFEIKALMGEAPQEAIDCAARARKDFPTHAGVFLHLIRAHRAVEGPAAARALAEEGVTAFPAAAAIRIELAEILRAQGDSAAAMAQLDEAARCEPRSPLPALNMALLHLAEHRPEEALEAADRARDLGRGIPRVDLVHASCLDAVGRPDAALAGMEALFARGQAGPAGIRDLVKTHLARGDLEAVARYLRAGQDLFPGHPVLVDQLVLNSGLTEEDFPPGQLAGWLSACLPRSRLRRLQALLRLGAFDFPGALAVLRATPRAERRAQHAELVAKVLLYSNRLKPAMRYLRLSLRAWPADPRLAGLVSATFSRAGHEQAGLALLQAVARRIPDGQATMARQVITLQANLGQLDAALASFRTALGQDPARARVQAHKLLRELAARGRGADAAAVLREGRAAGIWNDPHLQKSLLGQNMTELSIALIDPANGPLKPLPPDDSAGHLALVTAESQSNIAAMRFLVHWQTHLQTAPAARPEAEGPVVPRRIVQYWNAPEPPEALAGMIDSWRAAPGWEHEMYDRRAALDFLRRDCGPKWARAFSLANNPAQESDFLRLCVLACKGGVYADTDDILTAPLAPMIDRGAGFVAVLEPGLSVIGNNFIAAAPGHPLILLAAKMARGALLARANETTWSKTGPGLLTRAAALYLARQAETGAAADVAFLRFDDILGRIAIHNNAPHKRKAGDWRQSSRPRNEAVFARVLQECLDRHGAAKTQSAA
ncbi:MAG: hypothetical protein EP318_00255 [Rhodobacteraceae bacterium]|nr:MAG: hypothetical protein EP318_00255 [Paracoccaceae bacterium]